MLAGEALPFEDVELAELQSLDDVPESISVSPETTTTLEDLFATSVATGVEEATAFDADGEEIPITIIDQTNTSVAFTLSGNEEFLAHTHPIFESARGVDAEGNPGFVVEPLSSFDYNSLISVAAANGAVGSFVQSGDVTYLAVATQESLEPFADAASTGIPFDAVAEAQIDNFSRVRDAESQNEFLEATSPNSEAGQRLTLEERQAVRDNSNAAGAETLSVALYRGATGDQADGSTVLELVDPSELDSPAPTAPTPPSAPTPAPSSPVSSAPPVAPTTTLPPSAPPAAPSILTPAPTITAPPTLQPTALPTSQPATQPTAIPTAQPSGLSRPLTTFPNRPTTSIFPTAPTTAPTPSRTVSIYYRVGPFTRVFRAPIGQVIQNMGLGSPTQSSPCADGDCC